MPLVGEANLTQPAVSRSLKLLEEDIGADLFDRQGREAAADSGRPRAHPRRVRCSVRRARQMQAQRAAKDAYFDLRIGTVDSLGAHVLPNCLTRLQANHPELKLKLWMGRARALLEQSGSRHARSRVRRLLRPTFGAL